MIKPIILTDNTNGDKFTLEFNKDSVKFAEMRGFQLDDVQKFPMTHIPLLFFYAFRMHHKNVAKERTDKILEGIGGLPDGFLERLMQLYIEPFKAFDGDEETEKNATVSVEM